MQIVVSHATLSFGGVTVFRDFSAKFPAGQVTALVGPSGSGKSSLLAAMCGYQPLDEGRVEFRSGRPVSVQSPTASFVAWVPQGLSTLARRTVLDNVLIAPLSTGASMAESRSRAEEAIETVGLTSKLAEQARRLSGGELQRVGLARALASGKSIIFADEPSANLDAANTEIIAKLLTRLASRATIVVATHDPVLVAAARSAVYMREKAAARAAG